MSKSIGIAAKRLFAPLEIEILYKDKYKNRVFPATYQISNEKVIKYPYQYIGKNRIYIVPIKDLTIVKEN
jgi:propanediol utilization protein